MPSGTASVSSCVRHFARYLKQFEPETGRVAPHIFHDEKIVQLLAGARQIGPPGSIRPATYETLFGLMTSTGLRVSEAIHLLDTDVNLSPPIVMALCSSSALSNFAWANHRMQ